MQQMSTEDDRIDAALSGLEDHDTTHKWVGRILLVVVLIAAAGAAVWWFVLRKKGDPPKPSALTFDKNGVPCEWSSLYLTPLPSLLKSTATELEVYLGFPDPDYGVLRVATFESNQTIGLGLYPDKQKALPSSAKIKIQLCTGAAGVIVSMQDLALDQNATDKEPPLQKMSTTLSCGGSGGAAQYLRLISACGGPNPLNDRITTDGMNNSWGVAIQQPTTKAVLCYQQATLASGSQPNVRFIVMPKSGWRVLAFSIRSQLCAPSQPTIAPPKTLPPAIDYTGLMSLLGLSVSKARAKQSCPITYR